MSNKQKELVLEFIKLIDQIEDHRQHLFKLMDFLNQVLHTKGFVPPTAEMISVLKQEKPVLFQILKRTLSPHSPLSFVMQLDMDADKARERLTNIINGSHSNI